MESARQLFKDQCITTQDLVQVQLNTGLSNAKMIIASTMNKVSNSRIVGPNFESKFKMFGRKLLDFFTHKTV